MKNVIILGASGFVGINLAHELLKDDSINIFAIDEALSNDISLFYPLLKNPHYTLLQEDIKSLISADASEVYFCLNNDTLKINDDKYNYCINQTKLVDSVLSYTKQTGAKTLFIRDIGYFDKLLNDFENYLQSLILQNSIEHKTNIKIVKTGYLYGINSTKNNSNIITNSIVKALNNELITLEFDKEEYFIYIDDVVSALKTLMESYFDDEIINIFSSKKYLLGDVLKYIVKCLNSKSEIKINSSEIKKHATISNSHMPCTTPLSQGISKTIDFVKMMYFS